MKGIRSVEVIEDRNITRYASYFNGDVNTIKELEKAYNNDDVDTMRNLITSNTIYDFIDSLMRIYDGVIKEVTKKILDSNSMFLSGTGQQSFNKGFFKPSVKPVKRKPATTKKIVQKQKSGRKYARSKPTQYSRAELTFMKNNYDKSNKELVRLHNEYFPTRSSSSILSKKYRLLKKK